MDGDGLIVNFLLREKNFSQGEKSAINPSPSITIHHLLTPPVFFS